MCRFVAYIGRHPIVLGDVVDRPENSLVNQSREAREGIRVLNADGFGLGWYNQMVDGVPAMFHSIQPAWNDDNLRHLSNKVRSDCFIGHVRASTIGDVNRANCHPFSYNEVLFAHNGSIGEFPNIKRRVVELLDEDIYLSIKGQTDSEYFFALFLQYLYKYKGINSESMVKALQQAIVKIHKLQKRYNDNHISRLNVVITDGHRMVVSRYISSPEEEPHSLYYAIGHHLTCYNKRHRNEKSVLIASEKLTDCVPDWTALPHNHIMVIDESLSVHFEEICE